MRVESQAMRRIILSMALLLLVTGLAFPHEAWAQEPAVPVVPEEGQMVPDFNLTVIGGEMVTLSEQVGEGPVVLVFFRGAW